MNEDALKKDIATLQALLEGPDKIGSVEWFHKVRWGHERLMESYRTIRRLSGEKDESIFQW